MFDDDYIKEVSAAYWEEENEMRCGNHPSQILERVQNELDKNKIVGEITFMDYGIQDTRVQVHVNDSYYGTFNYIDNIFEDTPD